MYGVALRAQHINAFCLSSLGRRWVPAYLICQRIHPSKIARAAIASMRAHTLCPAPLLSALLLLSVASGASIATDPNTINDPKSDLQDNFIYLRYCAYGREDADNKLTTSVGGEQSRFRSLCSSTQQSHPSLLKEIHVGGTMLAEMHPAQLKPRSRRIAVIVGGALGGLILVGLAVLFFVG